MNVEQTASQVIIFSGPHGAGKDTLENRFREKHPDTAKIVRRITRDPAPDESNGLTLGRWLKSGAIHLRSEKY